MSRAKPLHPPTSAIPIARTPKYAKHGAFRAELNRRVNAYFEDNNLSKKGGFWLFLKAVIILGWFWLSYVAMVFWAEPYWMVALCAMSLAFALSGIGFSIMHDGGHGSSSERPWLNRVAAHTLDMVGGSSHLWAFKHNVIHHQFPNVDGIDHDIIAEPFLRMADSQTYRPHYRWQWVYFPLAYMFLSGKWMVFDDFKTMLRGQLGHMRTPTIPLKKKIEIVVWKLVTYTWAFVIPFIVHGVVWTLITFVIWASISGVVLAMVFQLAHCLDTAVLTPRPEQGNRLDTTWAQQQLATTVDFAPNNPLVTWYVGGLNFQIEHHLFPRISHVHYPKIAPIVREVCEQFGVPHRTNPTLRDALASHIRHLRRLGEPQRHERGFEAAESAASPK